MIEVDLDAACLNSYNAFVLDHNDVVYKWKGAKASHMENFNAARLVKDLLNNRPGVEMVEIDQDGEDDRFWDLLGGKKEFTDDPVMKEVHVDKKNMYKISDITGEMKIDEIDYERANLQSEDIFLVHSQDLLVVWIGNKSSQSEKKQCMMLGQKFLGDRKLGNSMKLYAVNEGNSARILDSMF